MSKSYGFAERATYNSRQVADCEHILEAHVVYDLHASGYKAQLRCQCAKVKIDGRKVHDACAQAEDDGKVMMRVAAVPLRVRSAASAARHSYASYATR